MANNSSNRYFVKNKLTDTFTDITTMFNGVAILSITGLLSKGKPVNIYTAQWNDSQKEDFMITTLDDEGTSVVIRENVDIEVTFIVGRRYASSRNIDVRSLHDTFVNYMTNTDIWLRTSYLNNRYVHCVCLKEYKPTTIYLGRGDNSYIMGTITLHALEAPVF